MNNSYKDAKENLCIDFLEKRKFFEDSNNPLKMQ